jgi:hypothetical protein
MGFEFLDGRAARACQPVLEPKRLPGVSGFSVRTHGVAAALLLVSAWAGSAQAAYATQAAHHGHAAGSGGWRQARRVGGAQITTISCASPGNCGAGGFTGGSGGQQAEVVSEVHGTWHKAIVIPGSEALNQSGQAEVASISCASAGNCSAGGQYIDAQTAGQAFVASQVRGTWHKAIEVPGTAAANGGGNANIVSVSCASAGNCSAAGYATDSSGITHFFIVSQVRGMWHEPVEIAGITDFNGSAAAGIASVSCSAPGNCGAGGWYIDSHGHQQAFVVRLADGTLRKFFQVPGTAALNTAGLARLTSVSCPSAGNCSAGGLYEVTVDEGRADGPFEPFVVSQVHGRWRKAIEVPGIAALNRSDAQTNAVSCASAGNCVAGGEYTDNRAHGDEDAFVVSEVHGTWRKAIEIPGFSALSVGTFGGVVTVSCASAGNCGAGGFYTGTHNHYQAFVASEVNGTWQRATEVPGTGALNAGGNARLDSVSCPRAGACAAGGSYTGSRGSQHAFVVNRK